MALREEEDRVIWV